MLLIELVVIEVTTVLLRQNGEVTERQLPERLGVMGGQHQTQVIHAGRRRWLRRLGLGHLTMHMPTEDGRDGRSGPVTLLVHVQLGEVLRIEAQLHAPTHQRLIDGVPIAS